MIPTISPAIAAGLLPNGFAKTNIGTPRSPISGFGGFTTAAFSKSAASKSTPFSFLRESIADNTRFLNSIFESDILSSLI